MMGQRGARPPVAAPSCIAKTCKRRVEHAIRDVLIQMSELERDRRFSTMHLSYIQGTQNVIGISVELHSSGEVTQLILETYAEGSETAGLRIEMRREKEKRGEKTYLT